MSEKPLEAILSAGFEEFTDQRYAAILDQAATSYRFVPFGSPTADGQALWRHDIDMSPHRALAMAELEAKRGLRSTYFVLLNSQFYNAFERAIVDRLREIASLGHWIGLHFELRSSDPAVTEEALIGDLVRERTILADLLDTPVDAFSFHWPGVYAASRFGNSEYGGLINAYADDIRHHYRYVSDSNGYWRFQPLSDVMKGSPPRLYVLTHPEWWVPDPLSPRARVERAVDGRSRWVLDDYDAFLERHGRVNVR